MPSDPQPARAPVVDTGASPSARLRPLGLGDVRLDDGFWARRRRRNREVSIPLQHRYIVDSGRLENFRWAAGAEGEHQGFVFNDSDVYKWVEALAWTLADGEDGDIRGMFDEAVGLIEGAQRPDGYLHTYYARDHAAERWTDLVHKHELYSSGHLMQAAVAAHRAGDERLLRVAGRLADHICDRFGPAAEGKQEETDGHPEIEMAMVELARETGERRYLDQARFFLDVRRGLGLINSAEQEILPFRDYRRMEGHAVCNVYLNAGATDVLLETGDQTLRPALEGMWENMALRQLYVTGGIGSRHHVESFGADYELPNGRAYTETCAAIGSFMWNWRMLLHSGDPRFADLMELTLYNGFLSGPSLDGRAYFYVNPLTDDGRHRRKEWYPCACCPPNVARLLASLPGYLATTDGEGIQVHLYSPCTIRSSVGSGEEVELAVRTGQPWSGDVEVEVRNATTFPLTLRVPAWAEGTSVTINGNRADVAAEPGSYTVIWRPWRAGDVVRLALPTPVRSVEAHPHVTEDRGAVAVTRGPLVYAFEAVDNPGIDPRDVVVNRRQSGTVTERPDLLDGVHTISVRGAVRTPGEGWRGRLYRTAMATGGGGVTRELTLVPYFAWANREPGPMQVWLTSP